ncbi:hypothetical protein AK812_SmicGene19010 [Symbiodinium microadriaticum]|uniref:Uncharacterized protein n=1 Tax=Symbiodinium microadriaticum TaxID=2951 RepID=A0A1Q9DTR6_SYMMI|nr:hypothetical protein AK812_SmicGene19010 [Symbiodinium microadriaticum]
MEPWGGLQVFFQPSTTVAVVEELTALESQVAEAAGPVAPDGSRGLGLKGVFQAASDTLEAARSELALALGCLERALQKPVDAEWTVDDRTHDDLEALEEAGRLRAAAQKARNAAEAKLANQRFMRSELLLRLQEVTKENAKAIERRQALLDEEAKLEAQLEAKCEEVEAETQEIRNEVLMQGRRLDARNTVRSFFQVPPRDAVRKCMRSTQECEPAKVIVQIKRNADMHLARVQSEQDRVQEKVEAIRAKHQKKAEALQEQWEQRKSRHQQEVEELQRELSEMEEKFEARWAEEDKALQEILASQDKRGQAAIAELETELLRQSDLLRNEVQSAQQESNTQEVDLKEVGESMEQELKARMEVKKQVMVETSEAEVRRRPPSAKIFQQGISYLREAYSRTPRVPQKIRLVAPTTEADSHILIWLMVVQTGETAVVTSWDSASRFLSAPQLESKLVERPLLQAEGANCSAAQTALRHNIPPYPVKGEYQQHDQDYAGGIATL